MLWLRKITLNYKTDKPTSISDVTMMALNTLSQVRLCLANPGNSNINENQAVCPFPTGEDRFKALSAAVAAAEVHLTESERERERSGPLLPIVS